MAQKALDVSGFFMYSQLVFIEEKNNGLGDMRDPTIFWTKKSAHVVFRRPINLEINDRLVLSQGETYFFNLQWGLFNGPDDENEGELYGDLEMGQELVVPIILGANRLIQTIGIGIFVIFALYA